jgi:transposase
MKRKRDDGKTKSLQQYGALNPHPEKVTDEEFLSNDFFDARDLVQVKYEMVRRVQTGRQVKQVAKAFGLSRTSYYEAQTAFEKAGLPGLLPQRPGPRGAHKLSDEVVEFVVEAMAKRTKATSSEMAVLVNEQFGLSVHPRSIERALKRRKKKQPKLRRMES